VKCIDGGHKFLLRNYDGGEPYQPIQFMKREGPGYPFNVGHYPGTNCQEVLRALVSRVEYLQSQIACWQNVATLFLLRMAIWMFERRAAKRHERRFPIRLLAGIDRLPTCEICGHVGCRGTHKNNS
jgi:hypothetical protein